MSEQVLKFKVGDCVKLKHNVDQPEKMIVDMSRVVPLTKRPEVNCKWFNTKEQKWEMQNFHQDALEMCK